LPSRSRAFTLLAGLLAAIAASVVAVAAGEYLNPSFRTLDDVQESLDVPVLASV
jgi:capsular polysaccharide biosynthesis protein